MVRFEPGDLVWIHISKGRFPSKRKSKLMPRADSPFQIIGKVDDNAYKVDLPGNYNVSATFNVKDLTPYLDDDDDSDLRTNHFQPGADDVHHGNYNPSRNFTLLSITPNPTVYFFTHHVDQPRNTSKDPLHVPNGPMTRSKTKALNALVLKVSTKSELKGPLEYQEEALDHNHLFFECSYTKAIWWDVCDRCDIPRMTKGWDEWIRWATISWHGKSFVNFSRKLSFAATVYHVWQERNARIFAGMSRTSNLVFNQIECIIRDKLDLMRNVVPTNKNKRIQRAWRVNTIDS
ncbi:hypothetical protein Peur_061191 [Populus x canadensis]